MGNEQETSFDGSEKDARILVKLEKTQLGEEIGRFKNTFKDIIPEKVEDDTDLMKNADMYSRRNNPIRIGIVENK
jgi:hypothetical protein